MIPVAGFVPATFRPLKRYSLPVPYVITYRDTYRFGKPQNFVAHERGYAEIVDRSGFRRIEFDIEIHSVHDVILVDRIE